MRNRSTLLVIGTFVLIGGSNRATAARWTLSQQGILALDSIASSGASPVSVTPSGAGVEFTIALTASTGGHLRLSRATGAGTLTGLPLSGSDTFELKFTLLTSTPSPAAYVSAGAIINFQGTWGYQPVQFGGPYPNSNVSVTHTDETVTSVVGLIIYLAPANQDQWPNGGTVRVLVEPAPGTTPLGPQVPAISGMRFVPVTPCRISDTRNAAGPLGGPLLSANQTRSFPIPSSGCGIPANAAAYSLNMTVVPQGFLGHVTIWPTGLPQPLVSTLNSFDGRVKANAAIVPAGINGAVSVFATNDTHVVLDINGYFVASSVPEPLGLLFFPLTPCRIADTRTGAGDFGAPRLSAGQSRAFPILDSPCNVPPNAFAYALNITVIPQEPLGFLTTWPTGKAQPYVSTLNAPTGTVVANAAIVPAGDQGSIAVFTTHATDLLIDINGYYAKPGAAGGLSLQTVDPCRLVDTRNPSGPLGGPMLSGGVARGFPLPSSPCGLPNTAKAYSLNATVVPSGFLGHVTLWPTGQPQPTVSTLNAFDGSLVANAALVPAGTAGSLTVYASNPAHLLLDANGFFDTPVAYTLLGIPTNVSPAPGTSFSNFPRTTTLTWTAVPGATHYGVQVQFCQAGVTDCKAWRYTATTTTSYTFDFVGAQPGRWRVWAIDNTTGRASAPSDWSTFFYTQ